MADSVNVKTGGKRNRAQRTMRGKRHIVGLRHGSDFSHFGKSPRVGKIGLDNIDAAGLQPPLIISFGKQPLPCCNGNIADGGDFGEAFHVFTQNRLFDKHGIEFLQLFGENLCHGLVDPAMEINGDAEILSAAFPDGGDAFQHSVYFMVAVQVLQLLGGVHFFLCGGADIDGTVAADPAVHPRFIAARAYSIRRWKI